MSAIMALPSPMLVALFLVALPSLGTAAKTPADACTCFRTNDTSAGYFASHRFFDFRNVAPFQSAIPAIITNVDAATHAPATSDYFQEDAWTGDWSIQNWTNSDSMASNGATVLMANSLNNIYIEKSDDPSYSTHLTLRTSRLDNFQTVAEFDSVEKNFQYLSARFMARVIGSPGACAGMFTYLHNDNPDKVQEADIEILTSGPRKVVQYTNQPSLDKSGDVLEQATVNGTQSLDWSQWNVYRLDWMPEKTSWYVNGKGVASIAFQVPRDPAGLIVNMWSNGGSWTGNMSLHDEAFLQIQWIELAYNTSGPFQGSSKRKRDNDDGGFGGPLVKRKGSKGCTVVCGIDEQIKNTGTPAVLFNSTGMSPLGWKREGGGILAWLPVLLVGAVVFGAV